MKIPKAVLLGVVALWSAAHLPARALMDPTRPPAALGVQEAATPPASGLQAILRRQGGRPAAVIHGRLVELGGSVGDARLEQVGDDSVTLQGPSGREVLWLTPGIDKKPAAGAGKSNDRRGSHD